MMKINHEELGVLVESYYNTKIPLLIYGGFGIGKSQVVMQKAREIAKTKGKTFVEWNKISKFEKLDLYKNPKNKFVFIDIRLSEFDSSDIKGLPKFDGNGDSIDFKSPLWALLMSQDGSDGMLFFDEIGLATPLIMGSCYKILHDRIVNESSMCKDWSIVGATNRDCDRAFTHTIPAPLKDRVGEVELLTPAIEDWTTWASQHDINSKIIGFVNFKPSCLYPEVNFEDSQKYTTTRGWERLSKLIKGNKIDNMFELVCKSAIGEGIASEFIAFCKLQDKFNLEEIIKNPKKLKDVEEVSVKYLLLSSVAERYSKEEKGIDFAKICEISKVLDEIGNAEFTALLWKLSSSYTKESKLFHNDFLKSKETKLIDKYTKYLS